MRKYLLIFVFICIPLMSLLAQVEQPPPIEDSKALKKIEAIKIWKLTELLDLDEQQSDKFFPRLRSLEKQRRNAFQTRKKHLDNLRKLLGNQAADSKLLAQINKIMSFDKQSKLEETKLRQEVMSVLSIKQQAKLLLFEEKFTKEVRKIIQGMRENKGVKPKQGRGF